MNKQQLLEIWKERIHIVTYRNLQYDISKIQQWFKETILPLPAAWQDAYSFKTWTAGTYPYDTPDNRLTFGGWSMLGPSKDYKAGWIPDGYLPAWNINITRDFSKATIKTDICTGPMSDLLDDLKRNGLTLSRARITISKPGLPLKWHSDNPYNPDDIGQKPLIRLQFPIIANSNVFFYSEQNKWHIRPDGIPKLTNTNHMHKLENNGNEIRFNLIADVNLDQMPDDDFYNEYDPVID
jgi:hypothetical protein